jgi:hypothetical protein
MDFEPCFVSGFFPILLPQDISVALEVKNLTRKSKPAKAMHAQVVKQLTGYMAKRILVAFEVGNVGVNAVAVGVLITPVYVQVLKLELSSMGTENVNVRLLKTKLAPLVCRAAFDRLVTTGCTRNYLKPELFPTDTDGEEPAVPRGLTLLWALMHATENTIAASLFQADFKEATATFLEFTNTGVFTPESCARKATSLIGTGAHGTVYRCSTDTTTCIKASRVGETIHIKRELKALKMLNANKCKNIPSLVRVGQLKYIIRNVTAVVPAIVISPFGEPVAAYRGEADIKKKKKKRAQELKADIQAALKFAHERDVFHLDVRLDNIIYDANAGVFVLIDWSSATCNGEKIVGFRGSLAFAHAFIHGKENTVEWSPKEEHDLASLAFSVAALMHTRAVPWDGFSRRLGNDASAKELFEERRTLARKLLKEAGIRTSDAVYKSMKGA